MVQEKNQPSHPFKIGSIGEIVVRCIKMDAMVAFYRDVIGLKVMAGSIGEGYVFFDISPGYSGHTTVLALFDFASTNQRDVHPQDVTPPNSGAASTLHHFALSLSEIEQDKAIAWFTSREIPFEVLYFDWVKWRGVFLTDPDGNTVELVAKIEPKSP